MQGLRQFSAHLTTCHACHGICTLNTTWGSPDRQCDSQKTRSTTPLKCCACYAKWRRSRPKCCACHDNYRTHFLKTSQKFCACHAKRLSTRYETRLNPECALLKRFNRFIGLEVHCWNASFIEINQQELLVWQLKICCIFQHRSVEIFNRISWFSRQKHQFLHVSKTKKQRLLNFLFPHV